MDIMEKIIFKPKVFGRCVTVRKTLGSEIIHSLIWKDIPFKNLIKWEWYFRYRAALMQVKYPRYHVDYQQWSYEAEGRCKERIEYDNAKRRLTTAKRMVTKITNGLLEIKKQELTMLLPDLDNAHVLDGRMKLEAYEREVETLTQFIEQYEKNR